MKVKGIIFDLDGTLMHTLPDIHASVNEMLSSEGYPTRGYESTVEGINRGARHLIAHALPEDATEAQIERALAVYSGIYAEHYADTSEPFSGIDALVLDLLADGFSLAVLSNKPDEFTRRLTHEAFGDSFSPVIGQGKYKTKPCPDAPLAIASEWGLSPDEIVFVGDSDVDMATAKAAGMHPVAVAWGYRGADVLRAAGAQTVADTPEALCEIIKTLE